MAKKKQEKPEIPDNGDVDKDIDYKKDIQDKSLEETVADELKEADKETPEETPKETPKESEKEEKSDKEDKTPAVEVDEKEIADKLKAEFMEDIRKKLGFDKKDEEKAKEEGLTPPWIKEKRNPKDYNEVAEWGATIAENKIKQQQEAQQQKQQQAVESQKARKQQLNEYWDEQLKELRELNKIPSVQDNTNPRDAGVSAEADLFTQLTDFNKKRIAEGKDQLLNLKEFAAYHYKPKREQPAGADAPVGGAGYVPPPTGGDEDFKYEDIHKKSLEDIISGK